MIDRAVILPASVAVLLLGLAVVPGLLPQGGDEDALREARIEALERQPAGRAVTLETGHLTAVIVAGSPYRGGQGLWCRHYSLTVAGDGQSDTSSHAACRLSDGEWVAASGPPPEVAEAR
ncbi:MAG: hypothetical protein HQL41_09535 [Alphaproteobacteria bacterium]|nr:hypothetical protein [Alphaproteobacteria bacterium]